MAPVHFYLKHHSVKAHRGGGGLATRYLERTGEYAPEAARYTQYHERTAGKWKELDDLRYRAVMNLPDWAQGDASLFFETAFREERANGRWATSMQANLPRDLTREQQIALTQTWIKAHLPNHPTLWVLHEPVSQADGLPQPHVHILYSARMVDGIAREPGQFFARYNADHPDRGGAKKAHMASRQVAYRLRESWCASANAYLEQAGSAERMDPRSFAVRGITRPAVRREAQGIKGLETPIVDERTPETRQQEAAMAAAWWDAYKREMGLTSAHLRDPDAAVQIIAREVSTPGTRDRELMQQSHDREVLAREAAILEKAIQTLTAEASLLAHMLGREDVPRRGRLQVHLYEDHSYGR